MWDVYVLSDGGECDKINSVPYDAEQVAMLLDEIQDDTARVVLLPTHRTDCDDLRAAIEPSSADSLRRS